MKFDTLKSDKEIFLSRLQYYIDKRGLKSIARFSIKLQLDSNNVHINIFRWRVVVIDSKRRSVFQQQKEQNNQMEKINQNNGDSRLTILYKRLKNSAKRKKGKERKIEGKKKEEEYCKLSL